MKDLPRALYIHVPWCIKKCPYCDFNSHEQASPDFADYGRALVNDLNADLERYGSTPFVSLFFGGGTPSLFPPKHLEPLFQRLRDLSLISSETEISLEANPGTLDLGHLNGYHDLGINRLSIGVQSFNRNVLRALGRIHDRDQAVAMIEQAKAIGFKRVNVDLMHGTPGQTPAIALEDLNIVKNLEVSHLSWYQLTIEPNTGFYSKPPKLPNENTLDATEKSGLDFITSMGLQQYEVSAFTRPGEEAKHNINYWEFGDYFGIGAGAHGKITTGRGVVRTQRTRQPVNYLARTDIHATQYALSDSHLGAECLMNGLRLKSGISYARFRERTGMEPVKFRKAYLMEADRLNMLKPDRFQTSEIGWRHLNHILEMLI